MDQTNTLQKLTTWHRYRPRRIFGGSTYAPPQTAIQHDIYSEVLAYVEKRLPRRRPKANQLETVIKQLHNKALVTNRPEDWLAALYARAPRAATAQQQMGQNPHGYQDKKARVYELIDFNDAFVATVLAMDQGMRARFVTQAKRGCDSICYQTHSAIFSDEQWTAIVRGLTREIAVYQAARDRGFDATMPNRTGDAIGIDLQVRDPESGRYINVDVKTPSSFRHRLEELVQQGRLTESELMDADARSYAIEHNGHNGGAVEIVLLCMLPDKFGEFGDFRLLNSEPMRQMLNFLIREHGLSDGRYGIYR